MTDKTKSSFLWQLLLLLLLSNVAYGGSYIDEEQYLVLNGKRFFPLGLYIGNSPSSDIALKELEEIADSPFDTILNYNINDGTVRQIRTYLDIANSRGLKVIYSLKDIYEGTQYYPGRVDRFVGEENIVKGLINEFKEHPAIIAWYVNDELPPKYIPRLEKRYKLIKSLDPSRPTYAVLYQVDEMKSYINTADIFGADPYPIPYKPISMVSNWTRKVKGSVGNQKGIWMVPQIHNTSIYTKDRYRGPTFDEIRCMAYQCIVNGSRGLIFYSYFDLKRDPDGYESRWADVKRLGKEIKSLIPILLSSDKPPKVQMTSSSKDICFVAKQYDGSTYVIAVNASNRGEKVEFTISSDVKDVEVIFEDRSISIDKFKFVDNFGPLAVHVYKVY